MENFVPLQSLLQSRQVRLELVPDIGQKLSNAEKGHEELVVFKTAKVLKVIKLPDRKGAETK
jgi:hypothetical protein